jgi:ComF family protein
MKQILKQKIIQIWNSFIHLFYPNNCILCGEPMVEGEKHFCIACLHKLPQTDEVDLISNDTAQLFYGKIPLVYASSFLYFKKGSDVQELVHAFKYRENKYLAYYLGRMAGRKFLQHNISHTIDYIIPIPLHKKRLRERGYNQAEWIAKGVASILKKPIDTTTLIRSEYNETQTKKNLFDRWKNVHYVFKTTHAQHVNQKHVLIVDDVITTGATIESAANTLLSDVSVDISLLSIAITQR